MGGALFLDSRAFCFMKKWKILEKHVPVLQVARTGVLIAALFVRREKQEVT